VTCDRSVGTPVSFTNKTDRHDISEILLKVALSTLALVPSEYLLSSTLDVLHIPNNQIRIVLSVVSNCYLKCAMFQLYHDEKKICLTNS
jgi:hypothetical protein